MAIQRPVISLVLALLVLYANSMLFLNSSMAPFLGSFGTSIDSTRDMPMKQQENRSLDDDDDKIVIDIVIPWSGLPTAAEQSTTDAGTRTAIERDRYNGEIVYLLRSIAMHAPWVRKIWILVNGENMPQDHAVVVPVVPKRLCNSTTTFVDRCSYMPVGSCPTRNSHAVGAFAHRIPGLAERFIIAEDDIFLGRPVTPADFFEHGKPRVWRKRANWGFFQSMGNKFHPIYENPLVASFQTPLSAQPSPHYWFPELKSVCASLEEQYTEFYAVVASHKEGRYSSMVNKASDERNSQEEDPYGWMSWELLRTGKGVFKNIDPHEGAWWQEVPISEEGFAKALSKRPVFLNVQDRYAKDDKATYKMQMDLFHGAMEKIFPVQLG